MPQKLLNCHRRRVDGRMGLQSDPYHHVYSRLEMSNNRVFAAEVPNPHVTPPGKSVHRGVNQSHVSAITPADETNILRTD